MEVDESAGRADLEGCLMCGALVLDRSSQTGTCPACQSRIHAAIYSHRQGAVPGLMDFGTSLYGTTGGMQNEIPIPLVEGVIYVGGRLTQNSLQPLQQRDVHRLIQLVDGQDDPSMYQVVGRMFDYRLVTQRDSVFDVYEQLVEIVRHNTITALYGIHPHGKRSKGVIVLLAFLMSFAGLSMHSAKEVLREKGIMGPEEFAGDNTQRVDDLADLFAAMQAS